MTGREPMTAGAGTGLGVNRGGLVEAGSTLVELMLALTLLMVCVSAVSATIQALERHQTMVDARFSELDRVELSTEAMSADIHAAVAPSSSITAFASATSTSMVLSASLGNANGPTQISIAWTATSGSLGTLTVASVAPNAGSAPNYQYTGTAKKLVTTDVNTSGGALFTYFDDNGNQITAPVSSSSLGSIASVQFQLSVQDNASPITLTDRVAVMDMAYSQASP